MLIDLYMFHSFFYKLILYCRKQGKGNKNSFLICQPTKKVKDPKYSIIRSQV